MTIKCSSCKTEILNDTETTKFTCPKCGKVEIVRCGSCRIRGIKYTCEGCGFVGP